VGAGGGVPERKDMHTYYSQHPSEWLLATSPACSTCPDFNNPSHL